LIASSRVGGFASALATPVLAAGVVLLPASPFDASAGFGSGFTAASTSALSFFLNASSGWQERLSGPLLRASAREHLRQLAM
jgi:hypothetical protein